MKLIEMEIALSEEKGIKGKIAFLPTGHLYVMQLDSKRYPRVHMTAGDSTGMVVKGTYDQVVANINAAVEDWKG